MYTYWQSPCLMPLVFFLHHHPSIPLKAIPIAIFYFCIRKFCCTQILGTFQGFPVDEQRELHLKDAHEELYGKFLCLQCDLDLEDRRQLLIHRIDVHKMDKFVCASCSKVNIQNQKLNAVVLKGGNG